MIALPDSKIMEYKEYIESYLRERTPEDRYASFDYCYNYFRSFRESGRIADIASEDHMEKSVLQLAFYLASWGMYRASTGLFRHSSVVLKPVIQTIAKTDSRYWDIDVDNYSENTINDLYTLYKNIGESIKINIDGNKREPTMTLITKIMLGVYGNTPALDSFVMKGIDQTNYPSLKVESVWKKLHKLYIEKQSTINEISIPTLQFAGGFSSFLYPKAKVIDMIFFERGKEISEQASS